MPSASYPESSSLLSDSVPLSDGLSAPSTIPPPLPLTPLRIVLILLFGQFLSFLLTCSSVFAQLLANDGVNVPTSQSFANYFLLAVVVGPIFLWRRWRERRAALREGADCNDSSSDRSPSSPSHPHCSSLLSLPPFYYLLLSVLDVEGNFFLVKSFQYTSLTSVQLLDCAAIPMVMALSYGIWRRRYNGLQVSGVCVCLVGLILLVVSDGFINSKSTSSSTPAPHPFLGDMLVVVGCVFYSLTNVCQEYIIKKPLYDVTEYLSMLGVGGTLVSGLQMAILERGDIAAVDWTNPRILLYFAGFGLCLFLVYILFPLFLRLTSAVIYNLSILSSDFFTIVAAFIFFAAASSITWLYYICFVMIVAGVATFHWGGREDGKAKISADRSGIAVETESSSGHVDESKRLDEESTNPLNSFGNTKLQLQQK